MAFVQDSSPSTLAKFIATAVVAGVGGYFLGLGSSVGVFGGPVTTPTAGDSSGDESESDDGDGELQEFAGSNEECKLVLVVRTDLGMTKGKIAAQCSHATLACYKAFLANSPDSPVLRRWERYGQMKVALQVKSEEELEILQAQAVSLGLCAKIIHDAGRTQIASGSATVLGIGPAPKSAVDQVSGHLKLL